jgi:hypothetical protein
MRAEGAGCDTEEGGQGAQSEKDSIHHYAFRPARRNLIVALLSDVGNWFRSCITRLRIMQSSGGRRS